MLVHLVAAWSNAGALNSDEHFQIIEFAQYALGAQSASHLAWEFGERMRPALQPAFAAIVIRAHHAAGVLSPFAIAFSLRLLSALLALVVSFEVCLRLLRPIETRWLRQAALLGSFAFWFVPTTHARFSSENWGGLWFAAGLCLLLDAADVWPSNPRRSAWLALGTGLLWSIAFYCRFQLGIAMAGAGLWLLLLRRQSPATLALVAAAFAAGCVANEALDRWLYGAWTLAPLRYFDVNLVQGKAATFGTSAWWMIIVYVIVVLIPPFSLAIIATLLVGSWYARRDVVVWIAVPFLVAHAAIARKEARFLIPMVYFAGPWFAVCVERFPARVRAVIDAWRRTTAGHVGVAAFCGIDVLLLLLAIMLPVNDGVRVDRWLWDARRRGQIVYSIDERSRRVPPEVTDSFYGSDIPIPRLSDASAAASPLFVHYEGVEMPSTLRARGCTPVVTSFPIWLARLQLFRQLTDIRQRAICRVGGSE